MNDLGIQTLAFDLAGRLYGGRDLLYSIDENSGESTIIGDGEYTDLRGIEFIIPEPSGSMLLLSAIAVVTFRLRRCY